MKLNSTDKRAGIYLNCLCYLKGKGDERGEKEITHISVFCVKLIGFETVDLMNVSIDFFRHGSTGVKYRCLISYQACFLNRKVGSQTYKLYSLKF